eukprot:scaffold412096_cov18-Prasinocladus_malaysianus.AAC.1
MTTDDANSAETTSGAASGAATVGACWRQKSFITLCTFAQISPRDQPTPASFGVVFYRHRDGA